MSEYTAGAGAPPPMTPAPKKTNWLLIGGIALGVVVLCGCLVCFGAPTLLSLAGPQIGAQFLGITCNIQYSDLSSDQCSKWASNIWANHQQDYLDCSNQAQGSGGNLDTNRLFACLKGKGLAPK